jgi:hypothetical protein
MPSPVSVTLIVACRLPDWRRTSIVPPAFVCLSAFSRTFESTCCSRTRSPLTTTGAEGVAFAKFTLLAKRSRPILDDRSKIEAHDFEVKIAAPRSLGV